VMWTVPSPRGIPTAKTLEKSNEAVQEVVIRL
jgi:hypothetical protein